MCLSKRIDQTSSQLLVGDLRRRSGQGTSCPGSPDPCHHIGLFRPCCCSFRARALGSVSGPPNRKKQNARDSCHFICMTIWIYLKLCILSVPCFSKCPTWPPM